LPPFGTPLSRYDASPELGADMRRRLFLTLAGALAASMPLASRAQQSGKVRHIAILDTTARELNTDIDALFKGLRALGYFEGQNLIVEYRSADGRNERLPDIVSELLRLNPDLIIVRGTPEIIAIKNANSKIPIVMSAVVDPVGLGLAASLNRPGGNITGMSSMVTELEAKRLEILREIVPTMKRMALLGDFRNSAVAMQWMEVQKAAESLAVEVVRFDVRSGEDINRAFETATGNHVDAIRIGVDGTTRPNKGLIIELASKYKLPAIYSAREFAFAADYADLYLRTATIVDKILKGANPAEIPVEQPTKFDLVVNLRTARSLGLTIPYVLVARADEVIE
jgi:putative tryptophan/tyrosine transport system substrate-binding protein